MRNTEANRTGQRSRRSWRIRHAVEQAGTLGKRRAVPGHDRSALDPIFESGPRLVVPQSLGGTQFSNQLALPRAIKRYPLMSKARLPLRTKPHNGSVKQKRPRGQFMFSANDPDALRQSTGEMPPFEPAGKLKARRDWRVQPRNIA
jgi:hypothetical protein